MHFPRRHDTRSRLYGCKCNWYERISCRAANKTHWEIGEGAISTHHIDLEAFAQRFFELR